MSTLKVDSIENGGAAVNFTTNLQAGDGFAKREYTSSATAPTGANNGALWWDTGNEVLKINLNGLWYTVGLVPPPAWAGARALFGGGQISLSSGTVNIIDYVTIQTTGNATDFGDLSITRHSTASCAGGSNASRGLFAGGDSDGTFTSTVIDYVAIGTTGNAVDFGDLTVGRSNAAGCSNGVRGLFAGGFTTVPSSSRLNTIDYVTIDTTGNAVDFGDLTVARNGAAGLSDGVYGVFAGGYNGSSSDTTIDYVTIATTGNAVDFGDLSGQRNGMAGCASTTRGVFAGGVLDGVSGAQNVIEYITTATPSNSTDFGDLTEGRTRLAGASDLTRGIFGGGYTTSARNTIDYVTVATTGNATDFGDLTQSRHNLSACSGN